MTSEGGGRDGPSPTTGLGPAEPDEWGADAAGGQPPRVPRPRTPTPEQPAGPLLLDDDTWEYGEDSEAAGETYQGRRRARLPGRRRWALGGVILAGLAAVVLIPLLMASLLGVNGGPPPATTPPLALPSDVIVPEPPVFTPASVTPTSTSTPTPTSTTASRPRTTRRSRPTATTTPPNPPPPSFGPLTFEAEGSSVTLGGSAVAWDFANASGGRVVAHVGDWGLRPGPGTVRFNDVAIPANGAYTLRIHFVHPDGEANRSAVVTVSGLAPMTVSFTGSATCCDVRSLAVTLGAGTHTVTISNTSGHAPSIDKIVISRP